jgi:hypothetical protein
VGYIAALALLVGGVVAALDAPLVPRNTARQVTPPKTEQTACAGARDPLPDVLSYKLSAGAFAGSGAPDVAVHVPPGFDGTWRPGMVVYFHGWNGCAAAAMTGDDVSCTDGGTPHPGADLVRQLDDAEVNALLVAVELRVDMPTGEPGKLAMPGGLRDLLRELLAERLAAPLGCTIDIDALDRVVLVAHSGGYQALAGALTVGDVPRVTEVDLLDALYGHEDEFLEWIRAQRERFDPDVADPLRFVDLYTCCGGTADASRALARRAADALGTDPSSGSRVFCASDAEPTGAIGGATLAHGVVFQHVAGSHGALPRAYFGDLVRSAGFAHREAAARTRTD